MFTFRNTKKVEKSTNMKSNISIVQENKALRINLELIDACYEVKNIIFFNPYTRKEKSFPAIKSNHEYVFKVKNDDLINQLSDDTYFNLSELQSIVKPINIANKKEGLWNWYAEIHIDINAAPAHVLEQIIEQVEKTEE